MLCHKQNFSFLGTYNHIPKHLTLEQPYFKGHTSKITVTQTERWTSYMSLIHAEPWVLPTAPQSCVIASVGSQAGLRNLSIWEEHMHITFRDSLLPSLQDQDSVMCHILSRAWAYSLTHRGWKDLIQCTFGLMRRVQASTKRHFTGLIRNQLLNLNISLFKLYCSSYFNKRATNNPLLIMSYVSIWGNMS